MGEGLSGEFEPVYLTLTDVLELHALIIGTTAPEAADQLRNRAGLESAIARPEPMPTTRRQTLHSRLPSWRTESQRASSSSTATSACTDRDARLSRDQRLACRSLRPRTGRLDPQLQHGCDTGGGRQARDLGDVQHQIAAASAR